MTKAEYSAERKMIKSKINHHVEMLIMFKEELKSLNREWLQLKTDRKQSRNI